MSVITTQYKEQTTLHLVEWEKTSLSKEKLSDEHLHLLKDRYSSVIRLERDTWSDDQWHLTSLGYVGAIPLEEDLVLHLHPKTDVRNIFRMIAYAYQLDLNFYDTYYQGETLPDLVDTLALILAERLLQRIRRGLYREYLHKIDRLDSLRGRLDLPRFIRSDWQSNLPCVFSEQTVDNQENQIICWTLYQLLRSQRLSPEVGSRVRKAWRSLSRSVSLVSCSSSQCVGRTYNRLKSDYKPMHLLCRFFLDHLLPAHHEGDRASLCFLIDMSRLFERFVAEWLRVSSELRSAGAYLVAQERADVGSRPSVVFIFDILLKERGSGKTLCVIDTKYKVQEKPSNEDIFQVVTYATQQQCREAVLIYPESPSSPLDITVGDVRVRSLAFPLDGATQEEFDGRGKRLVEEVLYRT